jgi:GT2 family glycosyltransferase
VVKKLAVIIINYNGKDLITKCLNSFSKIMKDYPTNLDSLELVVVDNGSTDGSREYLEQLRVNGLKLKIIFNRENLGFTGGNNVGIKYALKSGVDYIMLLNNDILIKDAFWVPMVDYLDKNKDVGVIGPKIYFAPGYEFHRDRYSDDERGNVIWYAGGIIDWDNVYTSHRGVDEVDIGQYDQIEETDFITGCCLMAGKEVWQKTGYLDDNYFLYYEDSDYSMRVKKLGWKTVYFPKAEIWHMNAGSSKVGSNLQDYYLTRNRLLFGIKWAPLKTKLLLLRESIKLLFSGRKWQKIAIRDYYFNKYGRGSWK